MRRYSMACRPIEKNGTLVTAGHGGRWTVIPDEDCPKCGRRMVLLGEVNAMPLHRIPTATSGSSETTP